MARKALIDIGALSAFRNGHRHVISWRSYANPNLHKSTLLYRYPTPPTEPEPSIPRYYAITNECPHVGLPLENGDIEDCADDIVICDDRDDPSLPTVICPFHGYDFNLRDGHSVTGNHEMQACTYRVQVENGRILMEPPGSTEEDWVVLGVRAVIEAFPESAPAVDLMPGLPPLDEIDTLVGFCRLVLMTAEPLQKVALTRELVKRFRAGQLTTITRGEKELLPKQPHEPPRPDYMKIVAPKNAVKRGKAGNEANRIRLLHSLACIELWAIDLAIDICSRFATWKVGSMDGKTGDPMPWTFFTDFLKVAEDEAKHFCMLNERLEQMGTTYGSLPVHNALWESAVETSESLFSRLAIIHLVHEARGIDVNPKQIEKLKNAGDVVSSDVIRVIHDDEITHVAAGHRHFQYLCQNMNPPLDTVQQFRTEVSTHFHGSLKGPFNASDRQKAGLSADWYEGL